ncbi:MAG: hypothetical protein WCW40_10790, partial [Bacteroidota bacterium]
YHKIFQHDTPETNARARSVMIVVYASLILIGGYFLFSSMSDETVSYKTLVQSIIMLSIGIGGIVISRQK